MPLRPLVRRYFLNGVGLIRNDTKQRLISAEYIVGPENVTGK